jgi:hypothetical protein
MRRGKVNEHGFKDGKVCRLCGGFKYNILYKTFSSSTLIGAPLPVIGYECAGCTVRFGDPEKWGVEAKVRRPPPSVNDRMGPVPGLNNRSVCEAPETPRFKRR